MNMHHQSESDAHPRLASERSRSTDPFAGGGEMGALMRSTDWSKTKLGPVENWPSSLRTMLGAVLGSRFPMLLWWGPDLLHLYNDAYRPILRDKHPQSLAAPAAEIWSEVWGVAGPMARGVQMGGAATWTEDLQLFIKSGAMAEETYFTFSYSPVPGDDGTVAGILNIVQETTVKVQSERQIRMLHDLAARAAEAKTEDDAYRLAAEALSTNELDLPFVLIYALNETRDHAHLVGVSRWSEYQGPAKPVQCRIDAPGGDSWPFAEAIRSTHEVVVENLSARFGPLPRGSWNAQPERAIVLPLSRAGQSNPYAFLVAGLSPHRTFDERYQTFVWATADQVANVIANAGAYEAEKKRAEALAEIDRAKTTFFSNVSHEFRTPLTLMLGPIEDGLADVSEALGPRQTARLQLAHDNALRLLKLVNALLDFSRLEAGRLRASFSPLDVGPFTAELAGMFQSAAEKAGIELHVDCPRIPEPAWVDRDMWEKVVPNLVSNALKFTFAGQVAVRVRQESEYVLLEVADTGIGIPPEELPRIFERFHRVQQAEGRTSEGMGIGLALVRELVALHGGHVTVESEVGRGTTFRVHIPRGFAHLPLEAVSQTPAAMAPTTGAVAYASEAARWANGREETRPNPEAVPTHHEGEARARILIVDDNADLRAYLSSLVAPTYDVLTATDGLAALEVVRECAPDIVVSDVMMPRLDGFGLVRALRADPRTASVPVILLSARAGEEAAIQGLDAGSDDYLAKPFSARELLARVRTHVELARMRRHWVAQLEQMNRELEAANKELDAFASSVSHDLRAPVRAVNGFASIVLQEYGSRMPSEALELLEHVRAAGARMDVLIDDLLRFCRLARRPLSKQSVNVVAMVDQIVKDLTRDTGGRHVDVRIGALPDVVADPSLLTQVFANLLSNAFKFTRPKEHPTIEVGCDREEGTHVFFVRDNGAGFDMKYAAKLFGIFQRLHSQEEFAGTGVGLSLVQRIVNRHGGRIWAEAEVGRGATFRFSIPD